MALDKMTDLYLRTSDPYPLQSAAFNGLHEFYAHLREGRLTTTRCLGCGSVCWPPRRFCPECLTDKFDWVDLPKEGTIHAFSIQEAGAPQGFPAPLVFAVVKVEELRIFSLISCSEPKKIALGQRVRFTTLAVTNEPGGEKRILHAFEPF